MMTELLVKGEDPTVSHVFGSECLVCDVVNDICKVLLPPEPCAIHELHIYVWEAGDIQTV